MAGNRRTERAVGRRVTAPVVDIHSHLYPRWYLDRLGRRRTAPCVVESAGGPQLLMTRADLASPGRAMTAEYWDLSRKLAYMDATGIDQTLLSLGNPWMDYLSPREGLAAACRLNAEFAELEVSTNRRIVGLGCLPPGPVAAVADMVDSVAGTAGLYGVMSGTRIAGRALDDPALAPVWQRLDATGLPIFFHPHAGVGAGSAEGLGRMLTVALGFPFEMTIAATHVLLAGVLERHPSVRLGFSHGGGALPYLVGRLDAAWSRTPTERRRSTTSPAAMLGRMFFDAVLFSEASLRLLVGLVGSARVGFGTDHPFGIADPDRLLGALNGFAPAARDALAGGSAATFFRLPPVPARDEDRQAVPSTLAIDRPAGRSES